MNIIPMNIARIGGKRAKPYICDGIAKGINEYGKKLHLDSANRVAYFLGQCAVESGNFSTLVENLNYSSKGLRVTFSRKRISDDQCRQLGRAKGRSANQEGIANLVYGGAWGKRNLGNVNLGDGWKFRGRGVKQITGRGNYKAFSDWAQKTFGTAPDFVTDPDLLCKFPWAFISAAWFWSARGVYRAADTKDIRKVTKTINGGYNGLKDRQKATVKAKQALGIRQLPNKQKTAPKTPDAQLQEYQVKLARLANGLKKPEYRTKPDGWNGPGTIRAVKAFQRDTPPLAVDGKLGPSTRAAIDGALRQPVKKRWFGR